MQIALTLRRLPVFTFLFFILSLSLYGQDQDQLPERLNLFIKCNSCDKNYLRQELPYVNHVRDQALCEVQLLINRVRNASSGETFELYFTGLAPFEGQEQQLRYDALPTATPDEVRAGLVKRIEAGLLPFLMETPQGERLQLEVIDSESTETAAMDNSDNWNSWIFQVYGEGGLEKEASRSELEFEAGLEADRVTELWRIRSDLEFNYSEDQYKSQEEQFTVVRKRHYFRGSVVRSLGDHWSAGLFTGLRHDTYRNFELTANLSPAVEFNIYPYREVVRREITFAYRVGYQFNKYLEETLFEKTQESLFQQAFDINLRFRQPWGDIYTSFVASSYLHDLSKHRFMLDSYLSIRLFKGLSVRLSGEVEFIRDQINLAKGDTSIEDVLLQQRQIATDFFTQVSIGLSYTFGAAYNNIVNTRL